MGVEMIGTDTNTKKKQSYLRGDTSGGTIGGKVTNTQIHKYKVTLEGTLVVVLEMVQPASAGVVMHVSSKVIWK